MSLKEAISVSEFVSKIKTVVTYEPQFQNVAIVGEVSNFTAHRSGHFYFSLKDDKSNIRAIMFRSHTQSVKFKPKDGDKVLVVGSLDVYEQSGQIQLYIKKMNLDGLGDLHIEFERLKKDLFEKGLFDDAHKKKLPSYPQSIGIITGKDTAAQADMSRTLKERWPLAKVTYYYSLVQGEYAKDDLIKNALLADQSHHDVIIIARGGGSIEDLWPFNELELVITLFNMNTPLISGIGHESDTTLTDYIADYRAATPTAAVVSATPSKEDILEILRNYKNAMYRSTVRKINSNNQNLKLIQDKRVFKEPLSLLDKHYMRLDLFNSQLLSNTNMFHKTSNQLNQMMTQFEHQIDKKLKQHEYQLEIKQERIRRSYQELSKTTALNLSNIESKLILSMTQKLDLNKSELTSIFNKLDLLNPFSIMKRGYGIIQKEDAVLRSIQDVQENDLINIKLSDGTLRANIIEIRGTEDE